MTASKLFESLQLPNGTVISNRIAKAAMEENLANAEHAPDERLIQLYRQWAEGGAGLILTGNVMVDRRALTGPAGVVLENDQQLERFRRWAQVCRSHGAQAWMQINHPGRQVMATMGQASWAPSSVAVKIPGFEKLFGVPKAMSETDIAAVIERFATTAKLAERAGFSGVQIHAAHGYLLSQFLSPLSNQRQDQWGGSLDNRARLLLECVKAVRACVSPQFCVAIKLNSADFQRGGFDARDAQQVVGWLNKLAVDLLEVSGGSYESPAMQGQTSDGRTLAREAYFLQFAEDLARLAKMPVMVTGGIRRRAVAEQVLRGPVAMLGMASALAIDPQLPMRWQRGELVDAAVPRVSWKNKALGSVAQSAVIKHQLNRLSLGKLSQPGVSPLRALICSQLKTKRLTRRYRNWMAGEA
ncbi:MAG: NADH:flavin oxidoreductase/NADH oxidase family protein [Pseudomonas sp.]|nr:NADH:flavin oxidoreductase/NADH oxidase family protein [Pseudomonas sp.]